MLTGASQSCSGRREVPRFAGLTKLIQSLHDIKLVVTIIALSPNLKTKPLARRGYLYRAMFRNGNLIVTLNMRTGVL
jgi:hypothetical protein